MNYTPVIGLEVHVELRTKSKMFCQCSAEYFGKSPNTHTCPVCLGLPGALPVPNITAIEWCTKIALALNCEINEFSKFDRKNYFYPDLPKGYQISQYDLPFGKNGSIELTSGTRIGIRRVHMEEDTGKLTHVAEKSLIDYNRSGVPLVEIVTEPDFNNAKDVKEYLQNLQQIVRYLDVSNADMEKGDMRLEPNISLANNEEIQKDKLPKYKVEVKNINSFSFVEKAINFEIDRQAKILDEKKIPQQETRGWNETKNETVSQRIKEEANDYRYFPEPDIPPITMSQDKISRLKSEVPELPDKKIVRFTNEHQLPHYDAEILSRDRFTADFFEKMVEYGKTHSLTPKQIANAVINKKVILDSTTPEEAVNLIAEANKKDGVSDDELEKAISNVVQENEKAVIDYKSGKETVIMFLVGMTIKKLGKKVDAQLVKKSLEEKLKLV